MSEALRLLLLLSLGSAQLDALAADAGSGDAILADPRIPLPLILRTPSGESDVAPTAELVGILSKLIREHTAFEVRRVESARVTACQDQWPCLVQAVGSEEVARGPSREKPPAARFLLIVTNVVIPGDRDRISAELVELETANEILEQGAESARGWDRDAAQQLSERARAMPTEHGALRSNLETQAFLEGLVLDKLAPVFSRIGLYEAYGAIELRIREPGVSILLDGRTVGRTIAGTTQLAQVLKGTRLINLEHPRFETESREISVERHRTTEVEFALVRRRTPSSIARTTTLLAGAAATVTGAAIVTWAVARHNGNVHTACFGGTERECRGGRQFETLSYASEAIDDEREINPRGVRAAPLGYSLAATGLVWSLGTWLFGDDQDLPWLQLGAGVLVGSLAYGLSAALDGHRND